MSNPIERLKQRFKGRLPEHRAPSTGNSTHLSPDDVLFNRLYDLSCQLDPGVDRTILERSEAIQTIAHLIETTVLNDEIEYLWQAAFHHLRGDSKDVQGALLSLAQACVLSEGAQSKTLRNSIYTALVSDVWIEDLTTQRIHIIRDLIKNGRDLRDLEDEIGEQLCKWLHNLPLLAPNQQVNIEKKKDGNVKNSSAAVRKVITLATDVLKYSFLSLPKHHIASLINSCCYIAAETTDNLIITDVLNLLDTAVRYGTAPSASLHAIADTLCATINLGAHTQITWGITRNLLKSHKVYKVTDKLLRLMSLGDQSALLKMRGAIFIISTASWGPQHVKNLTYPVSHILHHFERAAICGHPLVDMELLGSISHCIMYATELGCTEWDLILKVLVEVSGHFRKFRDDVTSETMSESDFAELVERFNILLTECGPIFSNLSGQRVDYLSKLLKASGAVMADDLAKSLFRHLTAPTIYPSNLDYIGSLCDLSTCLYLEGTNQRQRQDWLETVESKFPILTEDERTTLFEDVIVPMARRLPYEKDPQIFHGLILLLGRLAETSSDLIFIQVVEILVQNLLNTTSEAIPSMLLLAELLSAMAAQASVAITPGNGALSTDMSLFALTQLLKLFETRAIKYGGVGCLLIFKYLVRIPTFHATPRAIRLACLQYLLSLRADSSHRVLLPQVTLEHTQNLPSATAIETTESTPILLRSTLSCLVKTPASDSIGSVVEKKEPSESRTILPIAQHAAALLLILTREKDWEVYWFIICNINDQLSNLRFFQSAGPQLTVLKSFFCEMVSQERAAATIVDLPPSVRKSEIYLPVLRILTTLLAYRSFFARQDEDEVLAAIQTGLHRWPVAGKSCIKALTLALLELPQSMTKLLPATLLKVSQMMSTAMAASNLEFLATLAGLPMLRVNFTDADLKRVFVIALQYINTSFNAQHELAAFVVRLAYQVLLAWFVGLKLAERRKYVPFIIHYLLLGGESSKTLDENVELVLDLLIHHSFADCFPKPDDSTNKLTKTQQGQSRVWSQGNSLLTVQVADQPGWAHVTIRRPTGVISFNIMLENRLKVEVTFQLPLSVQVALQRARSARGAVPKSKGTYRPGSSGTTKYMLKRSDSDSRPVAPRRHARSISVTSLSSLLLGPHTPPSIDSSSHTQSLELMNSPGEVKRNDYFGDIGHASSHGSVGGRRGRSTSFSSVKGPEPSDGRTAPHLAPRAADDMFSSPTTSTGDMSSAISAIRSCEEQASIDPSFILSQFISYPNLLSRDSLIQLPDNETTKRSLSVLDRTPVIDLHKIGVVYVGPAQYTEKEILANNRGSRFYGHFLQTLGTFVTLRGCRQVYTGGLDTSEDLDGTHAIYCQDDLSQTIFHCTTMMPNNPHDPLGTAKKRHIGNDFVTIVWNESGKEYAFDTIPGQFNFVNIIIEAAGSLGSELIESAQDSVNTRGVTGEVRASPSPPSYARQFFKVWTRTRADMPDIGLFAEPKIVSAVSLVPFVRQAAMHANILSQLFQNAGNIDQHPSNARERLRQIKQIKVRAEMHKVGSAETTGGPSKSTESTPSRSQATSAHKLFKKQASGNLPGGSASGAGGLDSLPAFAEWETILDFTRFA